MTDPDRQYPSLVLFLGNRAKDAALREIFPHNNLRRRCRDGLVNLQLDSSQISSDTPLLFADGDPSATVPNRIGAASCHEGRVLPVHWHFQKSELGLHALHARLMATFSSVVCIFAEDLGGADRISDFLSQWIKFGNPSSLPPSARPRVIIVFRDSSIAATEDVLVMEELRQKLSHNHSGVFSSISVIHLAGDHVSSLARHRRLKEVVLSETKMARRPRIDSRICFSAIHFEAFFTRAIDHVARSIEEPFNFIQSARMPQTIQEDYRDHLATFLKLGIDQFLPYEGLTSLVASSILVDAYPPRTHKFDPIAVFTSLYRDHCKSAFEQVLHSPLFAQDLCTRIQDTLEYLFPAVDLGFETSIQLHINNLRPHEMLWTQLKSHRTCLFCLRRKPEHVLTCEHAICDVCVIRFGTPVAAKEAFFEINSCILCLSKGKLMARLKPPTAGARILSVDGGGVRGVVPLEFLGLLQGLFDLPVQELFEQAFGTSSGGLIVLGLFIQHWDVGHCNKVFDTMIRDFFAIHMTKSSGLLRRLRNLFRCWLSDGCYDVAALEQSLRDTFGYERKLFDADRVGVSGQKVAVTATTLTDASTYIFSNYNGGVKARGCGYKHVRPDKFEDEPFVWEAGRVTSAAPGLFQPASIESLGSFQDGGLRHNNPMDLAVLECSRLWPSETDPDVVLSLGTGTEAEVRTPRSPKAPGFRHLFNDGFIPRLCRSFLSSLDGERAWRDSVNRLSHGTRANYFRLNVPYSSLEPRLDDLKCMDALRTSIHLQPQGHKDRTDVAFALLVASFYFELYEPPSFAAGQYFCTGIIRCRNNFLAVFNSLIRLHGPQLDFVLGSEHLGELSREDVCRVCHLFSKRVQFNVRQLEDVISISVRASGLQCRKISGFPHSTLWFVQQQELDAPFGRMDHDLPVRWMCQACSAFVDQQKRSSTVKRRSECLANEQGYPQKRTKL
ncbi:hypothetical protein ACLMJK_007667 [Lecanora helva]